MGASTPAALRPERLRYGPEFTECTGPAVALTSDHASQPVYGDNENWPGAQALRTQSGLLPDIQFTILQAALAQHAASHAARLAVGPCATKLHMEASLEPTSCHDALPEWPATIAPPRPATMGVLPPDKRVTEASTENVRSRDTPALTSRYDT